MRSVRYILLVVLTALLSVACQRRPMEEEYLRVYLDLTVDKNITNYDMKSGEPGLLRVAFFDHNTGDYLSHDIVSEQGGYIFAPYGDVDIVVYDFETSKTFVRNTYSWFSMEAYTDEISDQQRGGFKRYLLSREDSRPSYEEICLTPSHLFVARATNVHIPRHISNDVFVINVTAKSIVESWTVEIKGVTGVEYIGSMSLMLSGQISTYFIATDTPATTPSVLYFDGVEAHRSEATLHTRFETFGREKTSGDQALLNILFTDVAGHLYMYTYDVSAQMENNPEQHIIIEDDINIPAPDVGGGFKPSVDNWEEFEYDIDI